MIAIQGAGILSSVHHKFFTNTDIWHCELMLKCFPQTHKSDYFPTAKDGVHGEKDITGRDG